MGARNRIWHMVLIQKNLCPIMQSREVHEHACLLQEYCKRHNIEIHTNIPRKGMARPQSQFHIHVSVIDLYIPTFVLSILLQENMWTDPRNTYKSLSDT